MKTRRLAPVLIALVGLVAAAGLSACTPQMGAVHAARSQIGMPYVSGGDSPSDGGFDCSGLTSYAWKQSGVTLPRTSSAQYAWTERISQAELRPGDLVFYSSSGSTSSITHVSLYIGDGKIVHARRPGISLREDVLDTWWTSNRVGYGRIPASAL